MQEEAAKRSRANSPGASQPEIIEVPEPDREAGQRSGSKSDSRISESELFQSFQIKAPGDGKNMGFDAKNINRKMPTLLRKARNTDLADLRFDLPHPVQIGRVDEVLHVAGRSYRNQPGIAGFVAVVVNH